MRTHGLRHTYTSGGCRCRPCTRANADYMRGWYRRRKQRGFSLIEICVALAVAAIMLCLAAPSFVHANNQTALQNAVNSFVWTYEQVPVLPKDPSWAVSGNTYSKSFATPAGTLSIVTPSTTGGSFSCAFSDPSYRLRC